MELISWTIYILKVGYKIFRKLACCKRKSLSSITVPIFMHEILQTSLAHIPATAAGDDLVPFIIPTSWVTRCGTGVTERSGSRLRTLPLLYLLSDIYTMFYDEVSRGEVLRCIMPCFRCQTEIHYSGLAVWGPAPRMNQYITLLYPFK